MADTVLLHGNAQSPEGWNLLSAHLVGLGHQTDTADLAVGDTRRRRHLGRRRADVIAAHGADRVARSGAAVLLPAVALRLGASHQVWLAAIIPGMERPLRSEIADAPGEVFNAEWLGQNSVAAPVLATYVLFHAAASRF